MHVKARVRNGRLVVDQATDLPEGTEVELVAVMNDADDALRPEDRDALHSALARAAEDLDRDNLVDGEEVMHRLRSRRR